MSNLPESIDRPYQVVCEGPDDIGFLSRMLSVDGVSWFQVGCGKDEEKRCGGKDWFWKRLALIKDYAVIPIRGIIVVADTDHDPIDRFKNACKQLRKQGFLAPTRPYEIVADGNGTKTSVAMIPSETRHGGLEDLILDCCTPVEPIATCIDTFCRCAGNPDPALHPAKLKLRTLIAATNQKDPSLALGYWLAEKTRSPHFGMDHPALDHLREFFRGIYL
jgi:hypothetical protein